MIQEFTKEFLKAALSDRDRAEHILMTEARFSSESGVIIKLQIGKKAFISSLGPAELMNDVILKRGNK